jgi:hypothetical protein
MQDDVILLYTDIWFFVLSIKFFGEFRVAHCFSVTCIHVFNVINMKEWSLTYAVRGRRGRDRMEVAISAYH